MATIWPVRGKRGNDKMKRFTEEFAGNRVSEVSNSINEYARNYECIIVQVSLIFVDYDCYKAIVVFEKE